MSTMIFKKLLKTKASFYIEIYISLKNSVYNGNADRCITIAMLAGAAIIPNVISQFTSSFMSVAKCLVTVNALDFA